MSVPSITDVGEKYADSKTDCEDERNDNTVIVCSDPSIDVQSHVQSENNSENGESKEY